MTTAAPSGSEETSAPRVLFVPVSGLEGTGELYRSLILAAAAARRWEHAAIAFVVHRRALDARVSRYRTFALEQSPTHSTGAVVAALEAFQPHIVVFDSTARIAQLRAARRLACRTVFISSRPSARSRAFRWRRLRRLDEYWIAQPAFLEPPLGAFERLKLRAAPRLALRVLGPLFEPPDADRRGRLLARLGLQPHRYLVFCAGGGGESARRRGAIDAFVRAGRRLAETSSSTSVILAGSAAAAIPASPGIMVVESLPHAELMDLLSTARLAVTNGGSLLLQALALRVMCVAVPLAPDQARRIEACARRGLVRPARADPAALVAAACELLESEAVSAAQRIALEDAAVANGLPLALESLEGLWTK